MFIKLSSCEYERILWEIITMGFLMKPASAKTANPSTVFIDRWKIPVRGKGLTANPSCWNSAISSASRVPIRRVTTTG